MRIIGGKYKGRRFPSSVPSGVRPTTDMARETLFNILGNYTDFQSVRVLDIFAGTGALGFECLSRGAEYCLFIEKNRKTASLINDFAVLLGLPEGAWEIAVGDAVKTVNRTLKEERKAPFDLVVLDPPYNLNINNLIVELLAKNSVVKPGGIVVSEHSSTHSLILPDGWEKLKERVFGETKIEIAVTAQN